VNKKVSKKGALINDLEMVEKPLFKRYIQAPYYAALKI
jgi:hypothetical protein